MDFKSMKWIDQKGNCKGIKCWRILRRAVLTREWVWWESSICSALKAQSSSSFSFLSFCLAALWASDLNMPNKLEFKVWVCQCSSLPSILYLLISNRMKRLILTLRRNWQEHIPGERWTRKIRRPLTRHRQPEIMFKIKLCIQYIKIMLCIQYILQFILTYFSWNLCLYS